MSKYDPLWRHLANCGSNNCTLSFDEIKGVLGFDIDHSFLTYKREAAEYGYTVAKISMKGKYVSFVKSDKTIC